MRQDLVSQITRQLSAVVSKRLGMVVGLWGEPGIGKTHAAHAVLERVPCHHLSLHATASGPQIVAALPRARTVSDWVQAQLARLERGELLEKEAFTGTLAAVLDSLAPFVLHLEDLHEADPERLELIEALAHAVARTRGVGLLVTSRAPLPEPFRNHRLEPLSFGQIRHLVARELKAEAPEDGLEWMFGRTRGNPLFTLEFVRYLARRGFLWSDGQRWNWRPPPEDFVPVTVEALVLDFASSLAASPETRAVLRARAIMPGAIDALEHQERFEQVWAQVAGVPLRVLEPARRALESGGVLKAEGFVHPLYREVIAASLGTEERYVLTRRALEALEAEPEAAAAFVDGAGLSPEECLERYRRAADAAQADGRRAQSGHWLACATDCAIGVERGRLALEASRRLEGADMPEAIRLKAIAAAELPDDQQAIFELANLYAYVGRTDDANQVLERLPGRISSEPVWIKALIRLRFSQLDFQNVVQLWNEHPDLHENVDESVAHMVAFAKMELDDADGAETLTAAALKQPDLSTKERINLLMTRGLAKRLVGQLAQARAFLDEAVQCACEWQVATTLASTLHNRQVVLEMMGLLPEMVTDLREAVSLYRSSGFTLKYASSLSQLGITLGYMGHFEEAELKLLEAHQLLLPYKDSSYLVSAEMNLSALYFQWRLPHALQMAQKYAQLALDRTRTHSPGRRAHALSLVAGVATALGQPQRGLELANEGLSLMQVRVETRTLLLITKAFALEALGAKSEVISLLESARASTHELWGQMVEFEIARLNGDLVRARALVEWLREHHAIFAVNEALRRMPELVPSEHAPVVQDSLRASTRIHVLGSVELEHDDRAVPTRARKRLEILTYLLETRISGRSEASALELIDAVYPDAPEPEARNTLKQQVYMIRSSLGAESVISTPNGYALGAVSSDAEEFLSADDSGLWRGAYLEGFHEGWRAEVREALMLGLRSRIETPGSGDAREIARLGAILLEMEPYDLDALRSVVQALEAAGDARSARRLFQEGRSRLQQIGEVLPETVEAFVIGRALV